MKRRKGLMFRPRSPNETRTGFSVGQIVCARVELADGRVGAGDDGVIEGVSPLGLFNEALYLVSFAGDLVDVWESQLTSWVKEDAK